MKHKIFLSIMMLAALGACAKRAPLGGAPGIQVLQTAEMPAPSQADIAPENRPYYIGPFDKLRIEVYGIEDLGARVVQVDASGKLAFPLAGTIDASGKTPNELAQVIETALRANYIRDPQVTVNLEETVSQVITVDGEVAVPGLYPVVGRMTLMRAIATARGLGEDADAQDVVIFRTVNGQKMAALYNLAAIRRGAYEDPQVYANDVVIVGRDPNAQFLRDLFASAPLLTTPLILLLQ